MLPLNGIKVLDLSRVLAGPYCSMLLGDMGADIIKVENTDKGDDTRQWGPPFVGEDSLYFWSINRNKRSISVNFNAVEGRSIINELSLQCDVLIENFIPGTLSKYGLDYCSMKMVAPHLIYCSISGFGQKGPMARRPGYDVVAAGVGGLLNITGPEGGPPCRVGVAVTDMMTGLFAKSSILAALFGKMNHKESHGCHIDCNLLSTQISMLFHMGANYLTNQIEPSRIGTSHSTLVPYQGFLTRDGRYFIAGAGNDRQFFQLCELLQLSHLSKDERFCTNALRVANRGHLIPILGRQFLTEDLHHWVDLFAESNLPNGPVNNMGEVFANSQVKFLSDTLVNCWRQPDGKMVSVPGFPVNCSTWEAQSQPLRPPRLGEHTKEVLSSLLGYSDKKIGDLQACHAILVGQ